MRRLFKKKTPAGPPPPPPVVEMEDTPPPVSGDSTFDSQDGAAAADNVNHGYSVHSDEQAGQRTPEKQDDRRWQVDYSPPPADLSYDTRQAAIPMTSRGYAPPQQHGRGYYPPQYGNTPRAGGFDYINWRPYGQRRRRPNEDAFEQQCGALAPYVRSVVVSACQGLEERRWAGEVGPPGALGTVPAPYAGSKASLRYM